MKICLLRKLNSAGNKNILRFVVKCAVHAVQLKRKFRIILADSSQSCLESRKSAHGLNQSRRNTAVANTACSGVLERTKVEIGVLLLLARARTCPAKPCRTSGLPSPQGKSGSRHTAHVWFALVRYAMTMFKFSHTVN